MINTMENQELKGLVKEALIEVLQDRRDLIRDVLDEALEDLGLLQAIEEGRNSQEVSREEVFAHLNSAS